MSEEFKFTPEQCMRLADQMIGMPIMSSAGMDVARICGVEFRDGRLMSISVTGDLANDLAKLDKMPRSFSISASVAVDKSVDDVDKSAEPPRCRHTNIVELAYIAPIRRFRCYDCNALGTLPLPLDYRTPQPDITWEEPEHV